MLVEDDEGIQEALVFLLEDSGYEITLAPTLDAAIELVEERTFDFVLTDLFARAPLHVAHPLDGLLPLQTKVFPTPIGLLTGWPIAPADAAARGFAFFLAKPFDIDELLTSIAAAVQAPLHDEDKEHIEVVHSYFAALSAHDWDKLISLCSDDFTYVLPGTSYLSKTVQGKAAFRAYTEETFRHFPEVNFEHIKIYATPQGLAARYLGTWITTTGSGRKLTKTKLCQAGSVLFQFDGPYIRQTGVQTNDQRLAALTAVTAVKSVK